VFATTLGGLPSASNSAACYICRHGRYAALRSLPSLSAKRLPSDSCLERYHGVCQFGNWTGRNTGAWHRSLAKLPARVDERRANRPKCPFNQSAGVPCNIVPRGSNLYPNCCTKLAKLACYHPQARSCCRTAPKLSYQPRFSLFILLQSPGPQIDLGVQSHLYCLAPKPFRGRGMSFSRHKG
jgi:hypothetical protein